MALFAIVARAMPACSRRGENANKFCSLCSTMPQNRSFLVADDLFFIYYYEILQLVYAGDAGQARALNARKPAVADQDGRSRTASQGSRWDCVLPTTKQPKSCSKPRDNQTGVQGLRPGSTQELHQPSNDELVKPLLAGDRSHHVAASVPRTQRFVLLPVPQLADLVAIPSGFASTPGYLKAIWPICVVPCAADLRCNHRRCKTSPVDLEEGFGSQVWQKIARKLARKFPAGLPRVPKAPSFLLF